MRCRSYESETGKSLAFMTNQKVIVFTGMTNTEKEAILRENGGSSLGCAESEELVGASSEGAEATGNAKESFLSEPKPAITFWKAMTCNSNQE